MTPHKHSPLPWAVRSQEFDDWGIIRDADLERAARAEWSRDDDLDSHRVAGTDPAQPNADFIVLACNSYYANQATIAAQAARIAWLERPMTGDEFDAAVMAFWRVYSTEGKKPRKERVTNEACADEAMRQSITAALAIRAMPVAPPFPEPLREAPEMGSWYWAADPCVSNFCSQYAWDGDDVDNRHLERGLCHATQEPAAAHGRYLVSLSSKTEGGA